MKKIFLFSLLIISLLLSYSHADAKKKHRVKLGYKPAAGVVVHIPVETIEALKVNDLEEASRSLRMEATSLRSRYILQQIQKAMNKEGSKSKSYIEAYNSGAAFHNLYLFLKGHDFTSELFFKKAMSFYKKALKAPLPEQKNNVRLTMAALQGANGDIKEAEKNFKKVDITTIKSPYRRYEGNALYCASVGMSECAIDNIKLAYETSADFTKFWLGISDDFVQLRTDPNFTALLNKLNIHELNTTDNSQILINATIP